MNPETALNLISALISKREPSISGRWVIVYRHGNFMVLPIELAEPGEELFGRYTYSDLTLGLSINQWKNLKYKITAFMIQKGL